MYTYMNYARVKICSINMLPFQDKIFCSSVICWSHQQWIMYLDLNRIKSFMQVYYKCIWNVIGLYYCYYSKIFFQDVTIKAQNNVTLEIQITKDKPPSPLCSLKPLQSKQSSSSVQVVSVSQALETHNKMLWKQKTKAGGSQKASVRDTLGWIKKKKKNHRQRQNVSRWAVSPFSVQHLPRE